MSEIGIHILLSAKLVGYLKYSGEKETGCGRLDS